MSYKTTKALNYKRFWDYYDEGKKSHLVSKTSAFAMYTEHCHEEFEEYRIEYELIYLEEFGKFPEEDKSVYSMMVEIEDKMFLNEEVRKKEIKSKILSLEEYEKIIKNKENDKLKEHAILWTTQIYWCGWAKLAEGSPNVEYLWKISDEEQREILKTARYIKSYNMLKNMKSRKQRKFIESKRYLYFDLDIFDLYDITHFDFYNLLVGEMPEGIVAKDKLHKLNRNFYRYNEKNEKYFWQTIKFHKDSNLGEISKIFYAMCATMHNKK